MTSTITISRQTQKWIAQSIELKGAEAFNNCEHETLIIIHRGSLMASSYPHFKTTLLAALFCQKNH
ncbi:hypothetical protein BCT06_03465 [Vibrio breoganii]|nr:hypothetical protein B003_15655 [Vibrio breoganii 1C10]PML54153.1 hypothetical protein BCT73_16745 [Vibrio breoganii]PMO56373.1 hypothetical protein BCT06_03465 [Vibrio breoganii]PMO79494.1 hypothetical protein BCT00_16510 [Vibrio breoganii]